MLLTSFLFLSSSCKSKSLKYGYYLLLSMIFCAVKRECMKDSNKRKVTENENISGNKVTDKKE